MAIKDSRIHTRLAIGGEHFVLLELPGGDERLEPVLDMSATGIAILLRSTRPALQPGTPLPRVRLFSNGACALDIQATVRDVSQVAIEGGGIGQKLGLQLQAPRGQRRAEAAIDTYDQPPVIATAVENLTSVRARTTIVPAGMEPFHEAATAVMIPGAGPGHPLTLELANPPAAPFPPFSVDKPYDLHAEDLGRHVALTALLVAQNGNLLRFDWPMILAVWRGRVGPRLRALPGPTPVRFETPFLRESRERDAVDLAPRGVAFVSPPEDGLMIGMLLPDLCITLPARSGKGRSRKIRGRGIVRHMRHSDGDRLIAGVELTSMAAADAKHLASYIDAKIHPRVRRASPDDLRRLWPVYEQTELFSRADAGAAMARIERERRGLLQRGTNVRLELVGATGGEPEGTVALLQAYPGTWSIQHLRIIEGSRLSADQLLVPAIETVARRPDFRYLHALVHVGEGGPDARLREIPNEGRGLAWREWLLCTPRADYTAPPTIAEVTAEAICDAGNDDLDWIDTKISSHFNATERAALALGRTEIQLDALSRIYRPAGMERRRVVRMAMSMSEPLGFALVEQSSPGTTLSGVADATRVIPTARLVAARTATTLALMHDAVGLHGDVGRRPLLLVEPGSAPAIAAAGFEIIGARVEVIADEHSAAQVINFVNLLS